MLPQCSLHHLTVLRVSFFHIAPVSLPPYVLVPRLRRLPEVTIVAAILLYRCQVFNINLFIWHRAQRRNPFAEECWKHPKQLDTSV